MNQLTEALISDMYRLYDFDVGPKKTPPRTFDRGNMVLIVRSPDEDGKFQQIALCSDEDDDDELALDSHSKRADGTPAESDEQHLVVYVEGDKVVLDRATLAQPNNDGWTPLHAACHVLPAQEAGIAILQALVAQQADLNLVTRRGPGSFSCGWTPLHIACAYGLEALTLKLVRAGANVNTSNSVGWTPLYDACHRGYVTVARELLRAGAKPDVICPEFALCPYPGQRALAEAARQGHVECVKALLEWGVDKDAVNKLGWSALHEAAYHSRLAVVQQLVVYGADVSLRTDRGSLARDLTIHSEIRAMLDDLLQLAPSSPTSKPSSTAAATTAPPPSTSSPSTSPKRGNSPTKPVVGAPLSRKEEYALLGDLPSLDATNIPSITIQDADGDDAKEENDGNEQDEAVDADAKNSPSKTKTKRKKTKTHKGRGGDGAVPPSFKCAVSRKLLREPMRSPFGHVFEREVMQAWFRDFGNRCPLTGEPLTMHQLVLDEKLRQEIAAWKHGPDKVHHDDDGNSVEASPAEIGESSRPAMEQAKAAEDDPYDF